MVTKPRLEKSADDVLFESCVVLDGDKTLLGNPDTAQRFESCVVLDGDKTGTVAHAAFSQFESCVVLDGDKTAVS